MPAPLLIDALCISDKTATGLRRAKKNRKVLGALNGFERWLLILPSGVGSHLEAPSIGWQLFILGSSQRDSTGFLSFLDTYAIRLLTSLLVRRALSNTPKPFHDRVCSLFMQKSGREFRRIGERGSSVNGRGACSRRQRRTPRQRRAPERQRSERTAAPTRGRSRPSRGLRGNPECARAKPGRAAPARVCRAPQRVRSLPSVPSRAGQQRIAEVLTLLEESHLPSAFSLLLLAEG
jgi:hypothetical protein